MKRCKRCKLYKSESEFSKCRTFRDGLSNRCKTCDNIYRKIKSEKAKQRVEEFIKAMISNGCQKCGENDRCVLEFHHLSDKEREISDMLRYSLAKIIRELSKCRLLCANCHKKAHNNRFNASDLPPLVDQV